MGYCNLKHDSTDASGKKFYRCRRCFRRTPHAVSNPPERVHRKCTRPGLGEIISTLLSEWGITKERVARWKSRWYGKPVDCGCLKRESALDRFGDRVIDWMRSFFIPPPN